MPGTETPHKTPALRDKDLLEYIQRWFPKGRDYLSNIIDGSIESTECPDDRLQAIAFYGAILTYMENADRRKLTRELS